MKRVRLGAYAYVRWEGRATSEGSWRVSWGFTRLRPGDGAAKTESFHDDGVKERERINGA